MMPSADSIFLRLVDPNCAYWVGGGEAVEGSCAGWTNIVESIGTLFCT